MKKLTQKIKDKIENGTYKSAGNWDAGGHFSLNIDWDCENYIISADEVMKELKGHLNKWPGLKKFKVKNKPRLTIDYVR